MSILLVLYLVCLGWREHGKVHWSTATELDWDRDMCRHHPAAPLFAPQPKKNLARAGEQHAPKKTDFVFYMFIFVSAHSRPFTNAHELTSVTHALLRGLFAAAVPSQ